MKYNYLARTNKGEVQTGKIEAPSEFIALNTLQARGLIIVKLSLIKKRDFLTGNIKIFERVKRKELFVFFRQLSVLVGAGVPLVQSLKSLADQSESAYFSEIISKLASDIDGGASFSNALVKHLKVFSLFTINLVKSGEVTGRLRETLLYLADHLEKEYYLISKVRGAMIYPIFILGTFAIVAILIMVMVMPSLAEILTEAGQDLPWPTRLLIGTSNLLVNWGWVMLLVACIGVFGLWQYLKTKAGHAQWDSLKLKLPIFGKILQKTYLARFADNLNVMIKGGVSIIKGLDISGRVIGNVVFQRIIFQARDDVKTGKSITNALEKHKVFPPLFYQMIKTGESTGKLDEILGKLSEFYNKEVDNIVNNLSQILEPLMIVLLGIAVSILVFAVYMPIYNLAGAF